jgi:hypothetical protein
MKRSQNLEIVGGDDRNDMEDMEHEGEDEDHVLTTMENNPNKKANEKKIKRMFIEVMAIHEALTKTSLNSI